MSQLRVRFAPSPTGHLHIGGARTALFNYLLVQKEQGVLVLRIEDTDPERSSQEYTDAILEAMDWLGLSYQEGPLYQSERFDLYKGKIQLLIDEGKAYRCYCTAEELTEKREKAMAEGRKPKYDGTCRQLTEPSDEKPYVIRFAAPQDGATSFEDRVKGRISFENTELDDLIIQRTDGSPTYNFVVVIDDAEMGITLVIRGDDHINNTPRQIQLYEALGYPVPDFAHVPMILGSDKSRLSKRHGATSVMAYKEQGYLPEAMINYLVRLGWSHGDQEIFSKDELIEKFEIESVGKAAGVFNPEKLLWINGHYIKSGDANRLAELLKPFLAEKGIDLSNGPDLVAAVKTLQERATTLVEMAEVAQFYYLAPDSYEEKPAGKFLTEKQKPILEELVVDMEQHDAFGHDGIDSLFKGFLERMELKLGKVGPSVRVALTGSGSSPSIYEVIEILGKDESIKRLKAAISFITR